MSLNKDDHAVDARAMKEKMRRKRCGELAQRSWDLFESPLAHVVVGVLDLNTSKPRLSVPSPSPPRALPPAHPASGRSRASIGVGREPFTRFEFLGSLG